MIYEIKFLISLLLTLSIELPILIIFLSYIKFKISFKKILFVGSLASSLTLPYLWFIVPSLDLKYSLFIGELLAITIEGIIYNQLFNLKINKAILLSAIANTTSFLIGLIIL